MSAIQPPPDPMGRMVDWENEPVPAIDALPAFAETAAAQIWHEVEFALQAAENARIDFEMDIPPSLFQALYAVHRAAENLLGCAQEAREVALHAHKIQRQTLSADAIYALLHALFPNGSRDDSDDNARVINYGSFAWVNVNVRTGRWQASTDEAHYAGGDIAGLVALATGASHAVAREAIEGEKK